jgi:hypothetical protein
MHRWWMGLLVCVALPAVAVDVGTLDSDYGGPGSLGLVRVPYDLGSPPTDFVESVRRLADGRTLMVGGAFNGNGYSMAVSVRTRTGTADTSVGPAGSFSLVPPGGNLNPAAMASAIAADGSHYLIGFNGDGLRVWRYALNGGLLGGPYALGNAGFEYRADEALVDAAGRLVVSGRVKPSGSNDAFIDAFVLRMLPDGTLDSGFGIRILSFAGAARDDGYRLREVGDGGYVVCSRVGDLDGSLLGYGLARLSANGSLDAGFNGGQLLTHFLQVAGQSYGAPCGGIGVLRTSTTTRFYVSGRADRAGVLSSSFVRVHQSDGNVLSSFGVGGQALYDWNAFLGISGDTSIEVGRDSADVGRPYLMTSGLFDSSVARTGIMRLTSLGTVDPSFGDGGMTFVGITIPVVGGTPRALRPVASFLSPESLLIGAQVTIESGNNDIVLMRLHGDRIHADGVE